jgi:hypothetical protein
MNPAISDKAYSVDKYLRFGVLKSEKGYDLP